MADVTQAGEEQILPAAFIEEMEALFHKMPGVSVAELPAFLESLRGERSYGLRRNPLKYDRVSFEADMPFSLKSVPWAEEGYFYLPSEQPGKSPYHAAGAYYMQEPSAMAAAEILGARPGERIADLCAAPGGKSSQIAGKMQGKGLLVCNEYVSSRAGILAQNLERMGVRNCVILKEDTAKLAERFPLFFDRVLADAPCSGEGMFRKEREALAQWSPENVAMCAKRQREILENAAILVRPGGVLVYSTCTFSEAENEDVIREFLERHQEFSADEGVLTKELLAVGVCPGGVSGTLRMWTHKIKGEGHFAARLLKAGEEPLKNALAERQLRPEDDKVRGKQNGRRGSRGGKSGATGQEREAEKLFLDFCRQYLKPEYLDILRGTGVLFGNGEHLFWMPALDAAMTLPDFRGLSAERVGLYLGEAKKGRFEPSHTWAMTLKKEDVLQWKESDDPAGYLRGAAEKNAGLSGWVLILLDGRPLGWGKASGEVIKNHYPKGLRK